ncbi:MAG: MATE family efflux transporter [Lachnospiraceae bacterium]|nr:MATE family efflux transporter [Lachnospiraceae bacterium]
METKNINVFEDLSVPKALAKFIIPSIISQLAMLILNLVDAFCVGRTGDTYQISAMTITFPIVMLIACVATIFGAGGNANIASAFGTGDKERAKRFSVFSVYTAIGVIIVLIVCIFFFQDPILRLLGADEHSIEFCKGYLFWVYYFGSIPCAFSQVMAQMFIAQGDTKIASLAIAGSGIINAILDPVFVFLFGMGIAGAGCATFIANIYSTAFLLIMYFKKRKNSVVCLNIRLYTPHDGIAKRVLSTGVPAGLTTLLLNCCDFIRNALLGSHGGQLELAAWGVVQKIGNAFTQICVGIAQGIRPLVAYNYTSGAKKRTTSIINGSFFITAIYCAVVLLFVNVFPAQLSGIFITAEEALPTAVTFLRTWIWAIIGLSFLELFNSIFQAMSKWKISMAIVIVSKVLLMVCMLILVHVLGVIGIIVTQPVTENLMAVITFFVYLNILQKEGKDI